MSYLPRDAQYTILHVDSDVVRATLGIAEFFLRPTVECRACYAAPRASTSLLADNAEGDAPESSQRGWLVGPDVEKAQSEEGWEDKYELRWPFREGVPEDWDGREFVLRHAYTLLGIPLKTNSSPLLLIPPSHPPSLPLSTQALYTQLSFETLNVPALSILPAPLAALFALGTTTGLVLHIGARKSYVSVVVDSVVRNECGAVVDVGQLDCEEWLAGLLMRDELLEKELKAADGLAEDASWAEGRKQKLIREVCGVVWRECTGEGDIEVPGKQGEKVVDLGKTEEKEDEGFDVAKKLVGDAVPAAPQPQSHKNKKAQQAADKQAAATKAASDAAAAALLADVITITIPSLPGKDVSLGAARHRLCEPLLLGKTPGGDTVWEGMGRAVEGSAALSLGERMSVWEGIGLVGEVAKIKSFGPALLTYLAPYLLSSPDVPSDLQPAKVKLLSIPDYFANFKGATSELAPFLGGSMVAKTVFSDAAGKHCITKIEYNAKGPAAVYTTTSEDK